jgi:hypothetical protein
MVSRVDPAAVGAADGVEGIIAGYDGSSNSTLSPGTPAATIADLIAAERSRNAALLPLEQIKRARELLEAVGLGHLRPDKAWRPRSWQDRMAAVPYPEDLLVDKLAEEIYGANWREPAPEWSAARDGFKEWSRRQARAALAYLRSSGAGVT